MLSKKLDAEVAFFCIRSGKDKDRGLYWREDSTWVKGAKVSESGSWEPTQRKGTKYLTQRWRLVAAADYIGGRVIKINTTKQ
jgi:hypothetical protein